MHKAAQKSQFVVAFICISQTFVYTDVKCVKFTTGQSYMTHTTGVRGNLMKRRKFRFTYGVYLYADPCFTRFIFVIFQVFSLILWRRKFFKMFYGNVNLTCTMLSSLV